MINNIQCNDWLENRIKQDNKLSALAYLSSKFNQGLHDSNIHYRQLLVRTNVKIRDKYYFTNHIHTIYYIEDLK